MNLAAENKEEGKEKRKVITERLREESCARRRSLEKIERAAVTVSATRLRVEPRPSSKGMVAAMLVGFYVEVWRIGEEDGKKMEPRGGFAR